MFSSQSFIVSGLTFQSLIHFELTFVCGVNEHSNFIFLHVVVQFSQHHLLRRLPFLHYICLLPLSKVNYPQVFGYIRGLLQAILDSPGYPVALITVSDFVPNCTVLMTVALQYNLKLGQFFQLCFPFSRLLWLFGIFCVFIQIVNFLVLVL